MSSIIEFFVAPDDTAAAGVAERGAGTNDNYETAPAPWLSHTIGRCENGETHAQ
ncbi:hypothetical protein AB0M80_34780 [Amycolatopsis sp. NPDC051045]|uniref:hypothetical protein n=1 Tax=Amycolatopsis sp. NPDC051045 TaxID=3156922 RepID=UPI003438F2CA